MPHPGGNAIVAAQSYIDNQQAPCAVRRILRAKATPIAGQRRPRRAKGVLPVIEQMAHIVTTDKAFDQVVAAIEARTPEKGFRVLGMHDVQAQLRDKGFEKEPLKIVEL